MKKVLAIVLALVLVLSLAACGSKADPTGSWKLTSMTANGKDAMEEEGFSLSALADKGFFFGLVCKDGKATLNLMGDEESLTYDDKSFTGKNGDGSDESIDYTLNGDTLTLSQKGDKDNTVMTFKKMTEDEANKYANQKTEDLQNAMFEMIMGSLDLSGLEE